MPDEVENEKEEVRRRKKAEERNRRQAVRTPAMVLEFSKTPVSQCLI